MTQLPDLMTIQQVADYLQVSISTVRRMLDDGRLPSVKIGRARRIPKEAVSELVSKGLEQWPEKWPRREEC